MNTTAIMILALPVLCLGLGCIVLVIWVSQTIADTNRKREAWKAFARAIGGQFEGTRFGKADQVKSMVYDWPVYLDTHAVGTAGRQLVEYTRLRAFFPPRKAFEAMLYTTDVSNEMPPAPGMTEIPGNTLGLQPNLIARTDQAELLQALVRNDDFARLVMTIAPLHLQIRRRRNWQDSGVSSSVCEVYVQERGIITDLERLQALYTLVVTCLNQLHAIGSAGRSFANVQRQF
jgi:hypothetical protein